MLENHSVVVLTENPLEFELETVDGELHAFPYEQIGIDEVRALITEAHRRPAEAETKKHILIQSNKITSEAQQAALKILEEPPESVSITLVLPSGTQLLPTILSRVQLQTESNTGESVAFTDWISLAHAERLKVVEEKLKAKDLEWQQALKSGLQNHLTGQHGYSATILAQLNQVVEELLTRGASNKMLLEHLALSLPLTAK